VASIFDHIGSVSSGITGAGIAGTLGESFSKGKIKSSDITRPLYAGMIAAYLAHRLAPNILQNKKDTKPPQKTEAESAKKSKPSTNENEGTAVEKQASFFGNSFVRSFLHTLASE